MQAAGFRLGIDFGTSHTVAVLRWPDGRARPLLFDGSPLLPSSVYAEPDGRLLVGRDAQHSARLDPGRFEPSPKRRIDEGSVLLGERELSVVELISAVLAQVAEEAQRTAGGAPASVTVTCPAAWGAPRRSVLSAAAARAGLGDVRLLEEPVAAANYFARVLGQKVGVGSVVVVHDFGGGTFDVSLVERTPDGFRTLAVDGRDDIGGLDLDEAVVGRIGKVYAASDPDAWRRLTEPASVEDRRQRRLFWDDVRAVKERLSRSVSAELHLPVLERDVHVTREEFEELARPLIEETARLTAAVIQHSGTPRERIVGVFLVGGSSRIPMVTTALHRALQIAPTIIEQPELVVAEGSVLSQAVDRGAEPQTMTMVATALPPGAQPVSSPPVSSPPVSGPPAYGVPISGPPAYRGPVSSPPAYGAPVSGLPVSAPPPVSRPLSPVPPPPAGYRPGASAVPVNRSVPVNRPVPVRVAATGGTYRPTRRGGGRRAVNTVLVLLIVVTLGVGGYLFKDRLLQMFGPGAAAPGTSNPDVLYGGAAGQPVKLVGRDGDVVDLAAGGKVQAVFRLADGWVIRRALTAAGTDTNVVVQQLDKTGNVLRTEQNTVSLLVDPAGTRIAVTDKAGTSTAWKVSSLATLGTTTLPSGKRLSGWVGPRLLVRVTDDGRFNRYDYWYPEQGEYRAAAASSGMALLGDSGDGTNLVALTQGTGSAVCISVLDVANQFQPTGSPRCDTGLTLAGLSNDDQLPVLSPDGTTLVARRGNGGVAYPMGTSGGAEVTLDGLPHTTITKVTWGQGVIFTQTADGFLRCPLAGGGCAELTLAPRDELPVTQLVVRFPAG